MVITAYYRYYSDNDKKTESQNIFLLINSFAYVLQNLKEKKYFLN